jgi:anti-sigma factor RsiW
MHDQLPAYFDGELDAARGGAFEDHLAACPQCADELAALRQLRAGLREPSLRHSPPPTLTGRVRSALATTRPTPAAARPRGGWFATAAALAVAVFVGAGVTLLIRTPRPDDQLATEVVANHARSLLADHLVDVGSTDRHTVKPWFQGRTDFAPPVVDLKEHGYLLVGGRLDVLDGRTIAALVYRRRQHVINLFVWPAADGEEEVKVLSRRGYNLAHWSESGLRFWAVSDLNADELTEFARLVRDPTP